MAIDFQIVALPIAEFQSFFGLSETELVEHNAQSIVVDQNPGYPCRVSLQDAEIGERVISISYFHHNVNSPYRA
jgi:hypothetical protein